MSSAISLSPHRLARPIGPPDGPVAVDVCADADVARDPRRVKGLRIFAGA